MKPLESEQVRKWGTDIVVCPAHFPTHSLSRLPAVRVSLVNSSATGAPFAKCESGLERMPVVERS